MTRNIGRPGVFYGYPCVVVDDGTVYTSAAKLLEAVIGPHVHQWHRDWRDVTGTLRCWCGATAHD